MDPRLAAAVTASRASAVAIRRLGRGGGTAAPGVIGNRIDPNLLDKLSRRLPAGTVVVAGTNGKTTTSRMLFDIIEAGGLHVIHNRSGSNLVRGVSAALAAQTSLLGRPAGDLAVIESDEAAFPEVVRRTQPRVILLLNLFRDQLDRYGELDTVAQHWRETLRRLDRSVRVVVNGDDPALTEMTEDIPAKRVIFGLEDDRYTLAEVPHAADSARCPRCQTPLRYQRLYLSHLGDFACPNCGFQRPALDIAGTELELHGLHGSSLDLKSADGDIPIEVGVPGLYNVYNALAAAAAARALGVSYKAVASAIAGFRSAFGRIETVEYRGRRLVIVLIKNPVGFNEVLRMLAMDAAGSPTLILINDLDADGRDVSWLWDVDVEQLAAGSAPLATGGIRGADMAVRLKYAGVPSGRISPLGDVELAFDQFVQGVPEGGNAFVLPTYTAMLRLRGLLAARGVVEAFWEQ